MIKFRTSSHNLEIEKGRHSKPKIAIEKRLCRVCSVIENEMHFLLHCKLYIAGRENFLHNIKQLYPLFTQFSDEDKMVFLLSLSFNDPHTLSLTAKFIFHAFETRNNIMKV